MEVRVFQHVIIERSNKDRTKPIGKLLDEQGTRGKVVFLDHLIVGEPPYGEVRVVELAWEQEKCAKAKFLAMPELTECPGDSHEYPYQSERSSRPSSYKAEAERNPDGKIMGVVVNVAYRSHYKERFLREDLNVVRPKHLDRDEVYHCPFTEISFHDWEGGCSVYAHFEPPVNRHMEKSIKLGLLSEIDESPFVDEVLNEQIRSRRLEDARLLEDHTHWWGSLQHREFFRDIQDCEWWLTDDGRYINHNPRIRPGDETLRIRVAEDVPSDLLTPEAARFVKEIRLISQRRDYESAEICSIDQKKHVHIFGGLIIEALIFVDTDGGHDTTGDEITIKLQRQPIKPADNQTRLEGSQIFWTAQDGTPLTVNCISLCQYWQQGGRFDVGMKDGPLDPILVDVAFSLNGPKPASKKLVKEFAGADVRWDDSQKLWLSSWPKCLDEESRRNSQEGARGTSGILEMFDEIVQEKVEAELERAKLHIEVVRYTGEKIAYNDDDPDDYDSNLRNYLEYCLRRRWPDAVITVSISREDPNCVKVIATQYERDVPEVVREIERFLDDCKHYQAYWWPKDEFDPQEVYSNVHWWHMWEPDRDAAKNTQW